MTEKSLAILGVCVMLGCAALAMAFGHDAAVGQIATMVPVGGGILVTLWKLGSNTETTNNVAKNVNGILDSRVEAAYREAYARGKIDGTNEADQKNKAVAEAAANVAKEVAEKAAEVAAKVVKDAKS